MNTFLKPSVLKWARTRAKLSVQELARAIGIEVQQIARWEETGEIDFSTVEKLAEKTFTPFGFLFLPEPPVETLPISDFRRVKGQALPGPPSPELLDVLYAAQRRQSWYRNYLIESGSAPLPFVGKVSLSTPASVTAQDIRSVLHIGSALTTRAETHEQALQLTIEAIEEAGILFLRVGFAGGHTHRKLSVDEFRGFALSDSYAPLVFINGADAPAAQMFTLAHEIAHIWLGESAVFNLEKTYAGDEAIETYCNKVAAEILVPLDEIKQLWRGGTDSEIERLSKYFRVSGLVIARRALDAGFLSSNDYSAYYAKLATRKKGGGGNWYINSQYENSRRFSAALIKDAKEGRTLYHDAMQLLGIKKDATFRKYAEMLHVTF